ncbi:phage minor tail protein L [Salmonella enterica]|nr:phage minor tail protein L [Salmonella enterica]
MQDIPQETRNETTRSEQPAKVDLWEIDLTPVGGQRYFFCRELNKKGEPVTWQGRKYDAYPISAGEFEMNAKGPDARPTVIISNLFGLVTGMAEDLQSLVGGVVVRRQVYEKFLDAVNFDGGNPDANPEQEAVARYSIEQLSELTSLTATFVLASPTETDGSVFPGRIMLAEICTWVYRGEDCGYSGPPVADEFDRPTANPAEDRCSKCPHACKMRGNIANYGGFLSINKLS